MSKATLTREDKAKIANRINYFRTMPYDIRKTAGNLEASGRTLFNDHVTHEQKSVLVGGRIMLLNCGT